MLKGKITKAISDGTMYTKDWKKEPLPVLTKTLPSNDSHLITKTINNSLPSSPQTKPSFRSVEISKNSPNKSKITQANPEKGSHSFSSGSVSDSSDSDNLKVYCKRFFSYEEKPKKRKKNR